MKLQLSDLWQWNGKIGRSSYAVWGYLLMAVKFMLDWLVASQGYGVAWSPFNYVFPGRVYGTVDPALQPMAGFFTVITVISLPFAWTGLVLTLRRLRDCGLPLWMVICFFPPVLNLFFFIMLCLLPTRSTDARPSPPARYPLLAWIPDSGLASAAVAVLLVAVLGYGASVLSVEVFEMYGLSLFVAVPFLCGMAAALLHSARQPRSLGECLSVATLTILVIGAGLFVFAFEGMVCLLMAAPLALGLALLGGAVGWHIQRHRAPRHDFPAILPSIALVVPLAIWMEHAAPPQASLFEVRSSVDIAAPPEAVWKQVIAFTIIPPPTDWVFKTGVAYPIRAEIVGQGPGAVRYCIFSTGPFIEPIEIWDEPRLLRFGVTHNPPPMHELSLYADIHPPHLDGYLASKRGQFQLTALPNGDTRLEGTTWYQHHMWPEWYWTMWSDFIIHRIHLRVLEHIKTECEQTGGRLIPASPAQSSSLPSAFVPPS